ncbi:MAG: ROK family protein [Aristaeellaceae bacterium]
MRQPQAGGQAALPAHLKELNRQKILRVILSGKVLTVADIHAQTSISRPTITRALQDYLRMGVIRSLGPGSTTSAGGKKPELFCFADERRILCANLWPGHITLALSSLIGDVSALDSAPCPPDASLTEAFALLGELAQAYLHRQGLTVRDLYGVVLSVPGTVDYAAKALRYNSQAPSWGVNVPLTEYLKPLFGDGLVYMIDNAGKAAGRATLMEHPEYADSRLMTLFTTWGVSACMMERGHILNGRDSLIGEIGHMVIREDGPDLCGCGKRGCLESLVSIRHVRRLLHQAGDSSDLSALTYRELFRRSAQGDVKAQSVVRHLARCFAAALHNLSLTYDQDAVVFQGEFAWADATFDQCLREELQQFRYYPAGQLFAIAYDRRELPLLAARGGAELLTKHYFASLSGHQA